MKLNQRIRWYSKRKKIMFFLWKERFLNPLVQRDMDKLNSSQFLNDEGVLEVLNKFLPEYEKFLPNGMYFPVPICRSIKNGNKFSTELALKFHYDFIKTDENQIWTLNNDNITGKVLKFFQANLFFEKETDLYFVEYRSENRWDKCYIDSEITPMLALNFFYEKNNLMVKLNNDKSDKIDLKSFRIDKKERCFVRSRNFGEVMLADAPRFWFLDNLYENESKIIFANREFNILLN